MVSNQDQKAHEIAAYWVMRLHSGEMTAQEEQSLMQWRSVPTNEQQWQQALETWDLASELYTQDAKKSELKPQSMPSSKGLGSHNWMGVAASILIVTVISGFWLFDDESSSLPSGPATVSITNGIDVRNDESNSLAATALLSATFKITEQRALSLDEVPQSYASDVGEVRHLQLSDGSTISLNTDSQVRVVMSPEQRQVELLGGEAFFDIATDPQRPFTVRVDDQEITVIGTAFNVRKRDDETTVKVAVVEGRVSIKRRSEVSSNVFEPIESQLLLAGDIGSFTERSKVIQQNQFDEARSVLAWRDGMMRFDNEELGQVVRELNRYRHRKIVLANTQTEALRISGVFHLGNGEGILAALQATLPVTMDDQGHQIIVTRK